MKKNILLISFLALIIYFVFAFAIFAFTSNMNFVLYGVFASFAYVVVLGFFSGMGWIEIGSLFLLGSVWGRKRD